MSKIKVNQIEAATGSTITVPSGQTLDISSATVSLPATALSTLNATNLTSGTVPDARFPATLPASSGANLTNLNASNLSSGTVPNARLSGITRDKLDLISTASDASLVAKGTAGVTDGYIQLNCEQNSHGIKIKSPTHASGANYTLVMPPSLGTSEQVLRMNSGATALEFGTISSGANAGEVIQVLSATDSTQRGTTSASFVTGGNDLTVTITPSSASNKILIIVSSTVFGNVNGTYVYYTIYRDATNLGQASNGMTLAYYENSATIMVPLSMTYLDSPNTTSAITYQVYMKKAGGGTGYLNVNDCKGSITCLEIKG